MNAEDENAAVDELAKCAEYVGSLHTGLLDDP